MGVSIRSIMTWEAPKKRWRKLYKGKLYIISARQLDCPETKEGSYKEANAWWERKRAEIDSAQDANKPHREFYQQALANRKDMIAWMQQEGRLEEYGDLYENLNKEVQHLEADFARTEPPPLETTYDGHLWHPLPINFDDPEYSNWWERIQSIRDHRRWTQTTDQDGTVSSMVDTYLDRRRNEVGAGQIKSTTYKALKDRLPHFKSFAGELDSSKIDERTISGYHAHLTRRVSAGGCSPQYAAHLLSAATSFVRWLWRERVLENLPRNLDALSIKVPLREIQTFEVSEIKALLKATSERTRLYILLMLNIGAYQSDLAALKPSQVNWEEGRITRKRTKTEDHANTPKVSYLLWDETFRLLKEYGRRDGPLVFLNENGSPVYRRLVKDNGKVGNTDNIKKAYERTCKKMKVKKPKPLMLLRKTSATMLETEEKYGRYAQNFLGHAPQSLAEKKYSRPDPKQLDEAVRWLGEQYGLKTTR